MPCDISFRSRHAGVSSTHATSPQHRWIVSSARDKRDMLSFRLSRAISASYRLRITLSPLPFSYQPTFRHDDWSLNTGYAITTTKKLAARKYQRSPTTVTSSPRLCFISGHFLGALAFTAAGRHRRLLWYWLLISRLLAHFDATTNYRYRTPPLTLTTSAYIFNTSISAIDQDSLAECHEISLQIASSRLFDLFQEITIQSL
jgi:hypothetical protein